MERPNPKNYIPTDFIRGVYEKDLEAYVDYLEQKASQLPQQTSNNSLFNMKQNILQELRTEKKKHLDSKNTPYIESRQYAVAHGSLSATLKAIEIVKRCFL